MRLIDADAKDLEQRINRNFGSVTRFTIKSILKDAPTIDAVPVVRCKDCKFYEIDEDGWCFCDCVGGLHQPDASDFCSYGERKDGEG